MITGVGTVTGKGQVQVPKEIREAIGIVPGDELVFEVAPGEREALEAELDRADPDDVPLDGDPRIDPAPAAMPPEAGGPGTVPGGDRPA